MESSTWEALIVGLMVLALIFWRRRGIQARLAHSAQAETDWIGLLIPIAGVIAFVVFLVSLV
jgi:hypothetical protein